MVRFISRFVGPLHVGDTCEIELDILVDGVLTDPTPFTDGDPADANALTIKVKTPAAVETLYPIGTNLVRLGVGRYRARIDCTEAGPWVFVWKSPTGPTKAAEPGNFDVDATI